MGSRIVRSAQQLKASKLELASDASLILANAVQNVIRSKRALLASRARLAALRKNREGIR